MNFLKRLFCHKEKSSNAEPVAAEPAPVEPSPAKPVYPPLSEKCSEEWTMREKRCREIADLAETLPPPQLVYSDNRRIAQAPLSLFGKTIPLRARFMENIPKDGYNYNSSLRLCCIDSMNKHFHDYDHLGGPNIPGRYEKEALICLLHLWGVEINHIHMCEIHDIGDDYYTGNFESYEEYIQDSTAGSKITENRIEGRYNGINLTIQFCFAMSRASFAYPKDCDDALTPLLERFEKLYCSEYTELRVLKL